jgi:hypothetical protein
MGRGTGLGIGAAAGGLLGAVGRAAVVYAFWLRGAGGDLSGVVLTVSAGIGLVVGGVAVLAAALVAGPRARPLVGAAVGAALAYLATILTFLPLFWGGLLGIGGVRVVGDEAPLYGALTAAAGALAGGCGSLLHGRLRRDSHRG